MTKRTTKAKFIGGSVAPQLRFRKPFWLSSQNYYFLTLGISIVSFFLIWGGLHAAEEETPWITSGIVVGLILILAVILREFVFKRAYQKNLLAQKRLDYNIRSVYKDSNQKNKNNRLTLERNSLILKQIESLSQTANSVGKLPELHLEVFELCNSYLNKSNRELEVIFKESPRYLAIREGQIKVEKLHRFHLLAWASIESQLYVQTSKVQVLMNDKIENAQRALAVLETAQQFYPSEPSLSESLIAIQSFIVSIKVSHWKEQAERATFKENYKRAINHYRDALFFLARLNERTPDHEVIADEINFKIDELRKKINETK